MERNKNKKHCEKQKTRNNDWITGTNTAKGKEMRIINVKAKGMN